MFDQSRSSSFRGQRNNCSPTAQIIDVPNITMHELQKQARNTLI
jgi:hypothetical protein